LNSDGEIGNPHFGQLQKSTAYGEPAWKLELEANFFLTLIAATCDKRKREKTLFERKWASFASSPNP